MRVNFAQFVPVNTSSDLERGNRKINADSSPNNFFQFWRYKVKVNM
jgi:hypothetical protein